MTRIDVGFILRLAAVHTAALCALTVAAYADWEEYQYETFDSTETIFPTGTFGEASYTVDSEGRYIVNGMASSVDSLAAINDSNSFYRVSADCQILSSTAGELAFCGLIFHYGKRPGDDKVSYYVFYVYGDGFYGVKRIINAGKSDVIIPLAQTELLASGEPNTLAVESRGNRFELFINGQPVNDFTDMKIDSGGYGLYISKHSIGAFDNFEVQLEPAPIRQQADVQRSEGRGGIKPLNIPRNPDRPLYPWEVGYDKDPKKKKRKIQQEDAAEPVRPQASKTTKPKKPAAKPTDELRRDTTSRSEKGFVADSKSIAKADDESSAKETQGGTSLRKQYQATRGEEADPVIKDVAPEADSISAPESVPPVEIPPLETEAESSAGVELEDSTVTDTGKVLPDEAAQDEVLYRRDPKFDEETSSQPSTADAEDEPTAAAKPTPTKRRRGLNTSGDDWETSARSVYQPKKRLPKTEPAEEPAEKTASAPVEAIASDGSKVKVQTVPLDGTPLRDDELEQEQPMPVDSAEVIPNEPATTSAPLDTSESLQDEPSLDLPEVEDRTAPVEEFAEAPLPSLDLPIVPSHEEPEPEPLDQDSPFDRPGQLELSDDFTAQQRWNAQELPTSSYRYVDGGYAIDNTKAQTMAISYQQDKFSDISLAVDTRHTLGADYVGYGLAARFRVGSDASGRTVISYYGLFISLSGEFMLLKVVDGQETVLKDWGLSPLIKLGENNRIELRVEGGQITALINGREAARVTDLDIDSGGYAFLAGPGIAAHYDNMNLTGVRE